MSDPFKPALTVDLGPSGSAQCLGLLASVGGLLSGGGSHFSERCCCRLCEDEVVFA